MLTCNNTMNVSNYTNVPDLEEIEKEYFHERGIPGVIFLSILSIVGVVGNVHMLIVLLLKTKKTLFTEYYSLMYAIDLIACAACMPFEIYDIRFMYTFGSLKACKFFRFFNLAVSLSSIGILAAIMLSMVLFITHPLSIRLHNRISAISIVGLSTALSVPALYLYGIAEVNTHFSGLVGTDCTVLCEYKGNRYFLGYGSVIVFFLTSCCIIIVTSSVKLAFVLRHSYSFRNKLKETITHRKPMYNNLNISLDVSSTKNKEHYKTRVRIKSNKDKIQTDESRALLGKLKYEYPLHSVVSIIGYMISVPTALVMVANPILFNQILWFSEILLQAFWVKNVINPVLRYSQNSELRKQCLKLYRRKR